jgi:hypothetical protein
MRITKPQFSNQSNDTLVRKKSIILKLLKCQNTSLSNIDFGKKKKRRYNLPHNPNNKLAEVIEGNLCSVASVAHILLDDQASVLL